MFFLRVQLNGKGESGEKPDGAPPGEQAISPVAPDPRGMGDAAGGASSTARISRARQRDSTRETPIRSFWT